MIGETFNYLTVLSFEGVNPHRKYLYKCSCRCGKEVVVVGSQLKSNRTKSCGCIKGVAQRKEDAKHRHTLYTTWTQMKQRCLNPRHHAFADYGGRGISISDEWISDFSEFANYVGQRPDGCTLDRINNDEGYRPGNVRWATRKEQANNRRDNRPNGNLY